MSGVLVALAIAALALVPGAQAAGFKNRPLVAQRLAAWQNGIQFPGTVILQRTHCSYDGRNVACTGKLRVQGEVMFTQIRLVKLSSTRARITTTWQGNTGFYQSSSKIISPARLNLRTW